MNPCLHFLADAYRVDRNLVLGRHVAGSSFLHGYLRHASTREFWIKVNTREEAETFETQLRASGRDEPLRVLGKGSPGELRHSGMLHHPDPGLGPLAWQRACFGHHRWSLCGITHTLSSAGAMDLVTNLLVAPVQPWDALICTSEAARSVVTRLLDAQTSYLRERLGATHMVLPQLPVIPLGIDTTAYVFDATQRRSARSALGIDEETLVVLFLGRLSFHAKAHPLAMYRALDQAVRASGRKVVLLECGHSPSPGIADSFAAAASVACPDLQVKTLDSSAKENRDLAWACADIFCSLSDNTQETFGLTPVEAMAAGLPVVVSDWNGYRDTVRDGIDGFRIPTLTPSPGFGSDLAQRHALGLDEYDRYIGYTASFVAVDVTAATTALHALLTSPELRRRMGQAGRQRARESFDWSAVIPRMEALWWELDDRRLRSAQSSEPSPAWPARQDPFELFAGYGTEVLHDGLMLSLSDRTLDQALHRARTLRSLSMVNYASSVLPSAAEVEDVLRLAATGPFSAAALVADQPESRRALVFRGLAWMLKLDLLTPQVRRRIGT